MLMVKGIDNFPSGQHSLYLALGNFDGVHLGHRKLINDLVAQAKANQGQGAAFIFEPHPARVLSPERAPRLLVSPERKAELLDELGLDILIYNSFTTDMARTSPHSFIEEILVRKLKVQGVFVGFNYTFGHKGAGNADMLKELGAEFGFKVSVIPPVLVEGEVVSSTMIRHFMEQGQIESAQQMLGYPPMIEGMIIEGEKRGGRIGFPTANLGVPADLSIPGKGVYAARALVDGEQYQAVVNIGSKPTFHKHYPISVEAHLLNFNRNIYHQTLRLFFLHKIRDEKRFGSVEELVNQIARDRDVAAQFK